ncbi:hypothetical protein [Gloeocapsopsis dulcis]|uniref:Uncharacterized protein n=1 Tax=Gloeocapsopsis dulcis AAB1 = 1H9 TaxID=1433147 RepID=A0A6N8FYQ0_9CHRO|nr:hypothetical protein [Gloeocapsopsis dulcis]MUL38268.1 hypothetical protein [Gloeocapsopsis dulcis AAB1 = 1H9]WNN89341.1 hypothetical protein P0S91_24425 [Gloeocapsopsis dulcis]
MNTKLPSNQVQFYLPNLDSLESSEQAFADAFLRTAQTLHQYLIQLQSAVKAIQGFTDEPFNSAILGLYSKLCSHYYSYVLLEIYQQDQIGINFLVEQLCEATITLMYLLEEADQALLYEYISASIEQACYLLVDVKDKLKESPKNVELLKLKEKLEIFVSTHQEYPTQYSSSTKPKTRWGFPTADTTNKRADLLGFKFICNPARQFSSKVTPASWLDLYLNYAQPSHNSASNSKLCINFTRLRDISHLCLHTTQSFLEEVVHRNNFSSSSLASQQNRLTSLYEWFHNAHRLYQLHHSQDH